MTRPTTRILAALELLQARGRLTGAELAQELGVDRRTVRRYVVALEELGVPISAERGRDGAYFLVAGFKLPPMMFTDEEALVLSLGLVAARDLGLSSAHPALAAVQAKLQRVMPARLKDRARAIHDTVALEGPRAGGPPLASEALAVLSEAAQRQLRVWLRYASAAGERSERELDPYGLGYRGGRWYVVGWCHRQGAVRSFRVDRITEVTLRAARFERPEGFEVLAQLTASIARLPRAFAIEVRLHAEPEVARRALFPAAGILEQTSSGLLLRSQADDLAWFARELCRLPFGFEVVAPRALAAAVAAHARKLLKSVHGRRGRAPKAVAG